MRILITGSRDWNDKQLLEQIILNKALVATCSGEDVIIVSGHCPTGADFLAEHLARSQPWTLEIHPADWVRYGNRAGFVRNSEMVKLGADVCLAFIRDCRKQNCKVDPNVHGSHGASMTATLAQNAGIETHIIRSE